MSHISKILTRPFDDQSFGTSGVRKKVSIFKQPHYIENIVQSIFNVIPRNKLIGSTWLISGDGRYYMSEAIDRILRVCVGNQLGLIWIAEKGLISTPAASAVIRNKENGTCLGAILLTASHNPGGENYDFGLKLNSKSGAPASSTLTSQIESELKKIEFYYSDENLPKLDLTHLKKGDIFYLKASNSLVDTVLRQFQRFTKTNINDTKQEGTVDHHSLCEIISPLEDWLTLMKNIFDFGLIKSFLKESRMPFIYDAMHGVGGIYGKHLFVTEFGLNEDCLLHCDPLPNFGELHPDPNPVQASTLYGLMHCPERFKIFTYCKKKISCTEKSFKNSKYQFGAATDGDCDRAMILGDSTYVSPCDSLAIILHYCRQCIPYFQSPENLKGVARSMPTSSAVDLVAKKIGIPCYSVPTGWKFFGNLMDADLIHICGEESFGAGSSHVREKDGLWTVLAWLSILAYKNRDYKTTNKFVTMQDILSEFYSEYGRVYYARYDFEDISLEKGQNVFSNLEDTIEQYKTDSDFFNHSFSSFTNVKSFDYFTYTDPVDNSTSKNGIQLITNDSRIIFRSSGTNSNGVTLRLYIEKYDQVNVGLDSIAYLMDLYNDAIRLCRLKEIADTDTPTVIA